LINGGKTVSDKLDHSAWPKHIRPSARSLAQIVEVLTEKRHASPPPSSRQRIFVYHVSPIDDWEGWTSLLKLLTTRSEWTGWINPEEIAHRWAVAQQLARQIYWEGDIRGGFFGDNGPWVCPLPLGECSNDYLIAWKQDNNGSTFIASPVELPWLQSMQPPAVGWV
jgi:hypothetical protein